MGNGNRQRHNDIRGQASTSVLFYGCKRHAVKSVAPEAFFRRFFSLSSDKKSTWTSAEDFMD